MSGGQIFYIFFRAFVLAMGLADNYAKQKSAEEEYHDERDCFVWCWAKEV